MELQLFVAKSDASAMELYHKNIKSCFPLLHSQNPIIEEAVKKAQSYWTKQIVGMQPI